MVDVGLTLITTSFAMEMPCLLRLSSLFKNQEVEVIKSFRYMARTTEEVPMSAEKLRQVWLPSKMPKYRLIWTLSGTTCHNLVV